MHCCYLPLNTIIMTQKILIGKVISDGEPVSDVAVKLQDRPCYISGEDGTFEYLVPEQGFTIEKIERPGYKLISPALPFTSNASEAPLTILMTRDESFSQRRLRKKAEELHEKALQLEENNKIKEAAQLFIDRSELDPDNVRWQYDTGRYFHYYKGYKVAQSFYNRAIKKAEELYGEKNQWLAMCYEAYGDNYFEWNVYFESGMGDENNTLHFADAKTYYQQAGHFWYTLLGEQSTHVAQIYEKMGKCWKHLENATNAIACYEKAYETYCAVYGENSRQVANTYLGLIAAYFEQKDYDQTMVLLQKLLSVEKALDGETSDIYQKVLHQIDILKRVMAQEADTAR